MGYVERRKRETWLQFLWHLTDAGSILLAFSLGYAIRFRFHPFVSLLPVTKGDPGFSIYLYAGFASVLLWIPIFHAFGLYTVRRPGTGPRAEGILRASLFAVLATAALTFFFRDVSFSRPTLVIVWFLAVFLLLLGRRVGARFMRLRLAQKPVRFIVVGATTQGRQIVEALRRLHGLSYAFAGYLAAPGESAASGEFLATWEDAREIAEEKGLDLIVFALPMKDQSVLLDILHDCRDLDLDYEFIPDLTGLISHTTHMDTIGGIPVIRLREVPLAGWNGVVKRTLDLVLSSLALILLSPLFLFLVIAIKLDSPGPVFYGQERMGRDKRVFKMLKFRSMRADAEARTGPVWARDRDERRTRVGRFLREWSLDELPQLWNVLMGQMSLVGPRPERPFFVEKFQGAVPLYFDRHRVKSGMTGWAQVNGLRGNVPIETRTRYDLYYIENWSLWLDLRILLMTLRAMVVARGA